MLLPPPLLRARFPQAPPWAQQCPGWLCGTQGESLRRMNHLTARVTACSSAFPSDLSTNKGLFVAPLRKGAATSMLRSQQREAGRDAGTNRRSGPGHNPHRNALSVSLTRAR